MVNRHLKGALGTLALALLGVGCGDQAGTTNGAAGSSSSAGTAPVGTSGAGGGSGAPTSGGMTNSAGTSASGGSAGTGGALGTGGGSGSGGSAGGSAGASGSGGGGAVSTEKFSFFVTSMKSMLALAKAKDPNANEGFGGDLTYGEVGPGAGLRGADKICAAVAELGMPGNNKRWRAFLSVTAGENGQPVNAISRIGSGPWYDRAGRTVAMNVAGLAGKERPVGDAAIMNDLPNEFGVPNHRPDPNQPEVDNHDTLTGSNADGELVAETMGNTCNDWTSKVGATGEPQCGHSWPRSASNGRQWIEEHEAPGCAPGVNVMGQGGPPQGNVTVGGGGGYGGFYCFALDP